MSPWGGQWDGQWDASWDDGSQGPYLRSLGCLDVIAKPSCPCEPCAKPTPTSNMFGALDDEITIPIEQLIRPSRKKKSTAVKMGLTTAWTKGKLSSNAPKSAGPEYPSLPCNGDPSSWWCLKAIQNYDNHMYEIYGITPEKTDIEVLRKTSAGIMGWALANVGKSEMNGEDIGQVPLVGSESSVGQRACHNKDINA